MRPLSAWTIVLLFPTLAAAQFSLDKTPTEEPPFERYEGASLEPFTRYGDNTDFDLDNGSAAGQSFFHDLDVAGGFMFVAGGRTFEIYDLAAFQAKPNLPIARVNAQDPLALPNWSNSDGGGSFFLNHIRAADKNLVAIGMDGQGFSVWKTSNQAAPSVAYQDIGVKAQQLHIVFASGAYWAFVADTGSGGGLMLYHLTNAATLSRCLDDSPASTPCTGAFMGEIGERSSLRSLAGAGHFLAVVPPGVNPTVEILDVEAPLNTISKLTGSLGNFPKAVTDIALWQAPGKLYLAALAVVNSSSTSNVEIYDVTCATTVGSCSLAAPVAILPAPDPTGGTQTTLSASTTGSRNFLYVGNSRRGGCAAQREYLFDVSVPSQAFDIAPNIHPAGYWGWYYMDCATGFNNIKPWRAYFFGDVFYRAAHSALDAHRLGPTRVFADSFQTESLNQWSAAIP